MPMLLHSEHASGATRSHEWIRALRTALTHPRTVLIGKAGATLVLLVVVGLVVGQLLGQAAATGIERLLDMVAVDDAG